MAARDGRANERHAAFDPATVCRADVARLKRAFAKRNPSAAAELAAAQDRLRARRASVPQIDYPPELPLTAHVDEIRRFLASHQVVIVAGETGSGKTTQLPKLCLQAGLGTRGAIVHTQPRRLAARAVAARIAEELVVPLGREVGYAVRFSDRTSPATLIKVMTDGLLLTEIRRDRDLDAYDVVIVDEAHERSLNIDFLLGYLHGLLERRADLKLIITSATIDVEKFSQHFAAAPVVNVGGRGHPVEVVYQEQDDVDDGIAAIERALDDIEGRPRSRATDVLVFLPGEREILETSRVLRGSRTTWDVLPLYARLPAAEQQRILSAGSRRRIVLATNVAETSLTVPNVGYVIDTGYVRMSRYSYRSKLQRLPVERISRASADQRMGRCGRVAPGVCFRLYSQADHLTQPEYTDPEILRTNLAQVVLQMRAFGLGEIERFPFIDAPDPRAIKDAMTLLTELAAIDGDRLTEVGISMARLPVDPRLSRMLVAASRLGALRELLIVTSGLAVVDPRERPLEHRAAADAAHRAFRDDRSDFSSLVRLWTWYEEARQSLGASALKRACRERFLSVSRLREWRDLHRQLTLSCRDLGWRVSAFDAKYDAVHRCILAGSLSLIGLKSEAGEYHGARNIAFRIFPGSGLVKAGPRWVVAAEISETARVYARTVAAVEPRWIEEMASHLLKRSHAEPHWDAKRGEAMIYERATLYGLPVVERRRISQKRIDRAGARDALIREGLVAGAMMRKPACVVHNLALVQEVRELEAKHRRRDLLVSEAALVDFYDARVPADVVDVRSFERWRHGIEAADPRSLFMTRDDVLSRGLVDDLEAQFPMQLDLAGISFDLKYAFAPGAADDGLSIQVPVGMLPELKPEPLEWLVPGLLAAKCEALLRSLPKALRRTLAPIPDKLDAVMRALERDESYRRGRLDLALGRVMAQQFDLRVPGDAWHVERLPDHLRMNIQVRSDDGRLLDQGRVLDELRHKLGAKVSARLDDANRADHEAADLERFPEAGVPERQVLVDGKAQVVMFPALVERDGHVDLVMTKTPTEQAEKSRQGYSRLVQNGDRQTSRYMRRLVREQRTLGLHYASLGTADRLVEEILHAATWSCFFEGEPLPRDGDAYRRRIESRRENWMPVFERVLEAAASTLARRFEVARRLDAETSPAFAETIADLSAQLAALVPADFLSRTPAARLVDLPRYLRAMVARLDGLQGRVEKDKELTDVVRGFDARIERLARGGCQSQTITELRFAIEELRVALFAQRIGTREKTSPKRVDEMVRRAEMLAGIR